MYIKINPFWLIEKSTIDYDLFYKINQKFIKVNHQGTIEDWTKKIINQKHDLYIESPAWPIFFSSVCDSNSYNFKEICYKYELFINNLIVSPNPNNLNYLKNLASDIAQNKFLTKQILLDIDTNLIHKILKRTYLISEFKHHWPWIGGLIPHHEPELCSLLCDISLIQNPGFESHHHLHSARKIKGLVNEDVYLGILHHRERPDGFGPFGLDEERTHIYGQIIYFCDNFLNNLDQKDHLEKWVFNNSHSLLNKPLISAYDQLI